MMNKVKKMIALLVVAILLVGGQKSITRSVKATDDVFQVNTLSDVSDEFITNSDEASRAITSFFNYLSNKIPSSEKEIGVYTVNGVPAEIVPAYFGGCYVNVYGNLIVEIVSDYYPLVLNEGEVYREFLEITHINPDNVYFRPVQKSYASLMGIMEKISYLACDECKNDIISWGIDDYNNGVVISVNKKIRKTQLNKILDAIEDCYYTLTYEEDGCEDYIGAYPGEGVSSSYGEFSIAFPAEKVVNGEHIEGFVTAGHCVSDTYIQNIYTYDGDLLGRYNPGNRVYAGNADAAFFEIASGVINYYTVYMSSTSLHNEIRVLAQGNVVKKRGAETGVTTGAVLSSSFSVLVSGVSFYDLVKMSNHADHGDSGCIVYTNPNAANIAYIVGVLKGGSQSTINPYSFYTKAGKALAALDVQLRE